MGNIDKKWVVYRHFDKDDRLLYVGCSADGWRRTLEHIEASRWFDRVAKTTYEYSPYSSHMLGKEEKIIREEHPLFNVRHNPPTTFARYMYQRKVTDDPKGDFVKDVFEDKGFPVDYNTWDLVENYLVFKGACLPALKAAKAFWRDYQKVAHAG